MEVTNGDKCKGLQGTDAISTACHAGQALLCLTPDLGLSMLFWQRKCPSLLTHQETKAIPIMGTCILMVHLVQVLSLPSSASFVLATVLAQLLSHGVPTLRVPGKGIVPSLSSDWRKSAISTAQEVAQLVGVIFACCVLKAKHDTVLWFIKHHGMCGILLLSHAGAQAFSIAQRFNCFCWCKKHVATNKRATHKSPNHDGSEHRNSFFRTNTAERIR